MPGERIAILDACVLVQAPLRDTLLRLAEAPGLYRPMWSDEIIIEMKRALETSIGLAARKTAYLERELRLHFPDAWVTGYEPLIRGMTNEEKDRHVLAAAAKTRAQTIVTFNKRHFAAAATSRWNVQAIGPSAFLEELHIAAPMIVIERIQQQAANLGRSFGTQLDVLAKAVPSFIEIIRRDVRLRKF
ncbi:MAG: PIN domain-containing protein [Bryobacteraceae bacterium]